MTCNEKCIKYTVCVLKKYGFANTDECKYYEEPRPKDKWITFGDEEKVYVNKHCSITVQKYRCPKCNGIIYIPKDYLVIYKFCPQCGEKMLKEKVTENDK